VGLGEQILEQIKRGIIEPLQIVKEQCQGMFRTSKHIDEPPKDQLDASLCFLGREFGNRRVLADDEPQFPGQSGNPQAVRPQRLNEVVTPLGKLRFPQPEKLTDEALERLRERGVRYVLLVLVELA